MNDDAAGDKPSPGPIWSSCLIVSFAAATLCSFVAAGHHSGGSLAATAAA